MSDRLRQQPGLLPRLQRRAANWQNNQRITSLARQVNAHAPADEQDPRPVVFMNASARLGGFSLNAAYTLLAGWAVRLAGAPVRHFVCQAGMSRCVLGTNRADLSQPPPCQACIQRSKHLNTSVEATWFTYQEHSGLSAVIRGLSIEDLSTFEFPSPPGLAEPVVPLGKLVLPSARWALRRHHLIDDESTRALLRQYILSAYSIIVQFVTFVQEVNPRLAVIFNGILYPEAATTWVARQLGIRTVSYEVGFQPYSVFFTSGDPTAYPIHIPDDFDLSPEQSARLDALLENRFQGQFTMAGIRFWPEMRGLAPAFLQKAAGFRQIVPVFTNVVYDTSQVHANTLFSNMFAWLNMVLEIIQRHPETLFVIRAHPDEKRPFSRKVSTESVHDWIYHLQVNNLPNVVFIEPDEFISSYELIQRSKFVLVYNSSIGLESVLLGVPVICGGRARYTQYPSVYLPESPQALREQVEDFLAAKEIPMPPEFLRNARRFLYYQFFRVSIPLDDFLQEGEKQGFVSLRPFEWTQLLAENSPSIQALLDGLLHQRPFLIPELTST